MGLGIEGAFTSSRLPGRRSWTGWLLLTAVLAVLACNQASDVTPGQPPSTLSAESEGEEVLTRFLLGGWVLPRHEEAKDSPFAETLRTFVITSEEELRSFLEGVSMRRLRGNPDTLNRTDFDEVLVLATYYLWRPVKGDPMSIEKVTLSGTEVRIAVDLVEDPPGKEFPYLWAPMYIVGIERTELPADVPLTLVFQVNDKVAATRSLVLD